MTLGEAVRQAAERLGEAGVASPRADAELLAAHVLGLSRAEVSRLVLVGGTPQEPGFAAAYDDLVGERARRVPLQHLTGRAPFRDLELAVGPGVFVPRPETEDVAGAAIDLARAVTAPDGAGPAGEAALAGEAGVLVVDLCSGSAAIALAVATEVPAAQVVAVEVSEPARAWAAANIAALAPGRVDLRAADVTSPTAGETLADLTGRVDVVVSNPPYIPPGHEPLEAEVRDHDPEVALYGGGPDGLAVPRAVVALAGALLRAGGRLVMEHADSQGPGVVHLLAGTPGWTDVEDHRDLAGRPRYVTARRVAPDR